MVIIDVVPMKIAITRKCIDVEEVAKMAGVRVDTVYKILRGSSNPRMVTVGKLSKALGIDPAEIIKG